MQPVHGVHLMREQFFPKEAEVLFDKRGTHLAVNVQVRFEARQMKASQTTALRLPREFASRS